MKENTFTTPLGVIHYWTNEHQPGRQTLVMLPGLTADHRLFNLQVAHFEEHYNLLLWDAPGHNASRPFRLLFSLADKADWLLAILDREGVERPVLIGQSMGGYVSQMFMQRHPGRAAGYVAIDSPSLKRCYVTATELWMLRHCERMYRWYPWEQLVKDGAKGCCTTPQGVQQMAAMMRSYQHLEYARLAGHGYRILADTMAADLPYQPHCPALYLIGDHDRAGSCRRYYRAMARREGIAITWVPNAGHNSNVDNPDFVNSQIEDFLATLQTRPKTIA